MNMEREYWAVIKRKDTTLSLFLGQLRFRSGDLKTYLVMPTSATNKNSGVRTVKVRLCCAWWSYKHYFNTIELLSNCHGGFLFVRYKGHCCTEFVSLEHAACPLSGIKKRSLVGGWLNTSSVVISIGATAGVRYRGCLLVGGSVMGGSTVLYFA